MKPMSDLLAKAKALETPTTPRAWSEKVISGKSNMADVPDGFRLIVEDHIATHEMYVINASDRILALPNGKARLGRSMRLQRL